MLAITDRVFQHPTAVRHLETAAYPSYPYDPPAYYPEFRQWHKDIDPQNHVYGAVRNIIRDVGLDQDNFNRPDWNPFGDLVSQGQRVLIKPNWVLHANHLDGSIESLVTHTSVIRVLLDYLMVALDGRGIVEIADAPLQGCDFDLLRERTKIERLLDLYRTQFPRVRFASVDLRKTTLSPRSKWGRDGGRQLSQSGDPRGYTLVDLGQESLLTDIEDRSNRFRVTMYDHRLMARHHARGKHEYLIANSVLEADLIINVPKLKTHIKAGITASLKNLVGINGHKEYLPHHVNGSPATGGDQYQHVSIVKPLINRLKDRYWREDFQRSGTVSLVHEYLIRALHVPSKVLDKDRMFEGGWSGNDTIPRTTLDLNNIMYFYCCERQRLLERPVRKVLHVVDGVIAGDGYGPLWPTAKPAGVVIGGWNPLAIDTYGAMLIGLDPMKVRLLRYGFEHPQSRLASLTQQLSELEITAEGELLPVSQTSSLSFRLPQEWEDASV